MKKKIQNNFGEKIIKFLILFFLKKFQKIIELTKKVTEKTFFVNFQVFFSNFIKKSCGEKIGK